MGESPKRIVIVGAGQAGGQAAYSLRQHGYDGEIVLIGDEPAPPYQRPPLSKAYLKGEMEEERLYLKPIEYYAEHRVELLTNAKVAAIDAGAKSLSLASGSKLSWDRLVIATGARPRRLPVPGAQLDGVLELRTLADVDRLKARVAPGARIVVVGAGYIGLEAAAVASQLGMQATVLEAMPRVLARVAGPEISDFYAGVHRAAGVDIRLGARLEGFEGVGKVLAARLATGEQVACDVALVGVGVIANAELAKEAGIQIGDGILTDRRTRTSHPDVFAIGDVAFRPLAHYEGGMRIESVHNAIEGGKTAAAAILGMPHPAEDVPWFWSDQYDLKLQTAGISTGADTVVTRGDPASRSFAVFYLRQGRVVAADAVNAAPEYMIGKKLVAASASVAPAELADKSISMKDIGAKALKPA
jgi:3-phenylpropionate/trans-cinnamate dioxygenase ferredoxin reductase subunit